MPRRFVSLSLLAAGLAFAGLPAASIAAAGKEHAPAAAKAAAGVTTAKLSLVGLSCAVCAARTARVLRSVKGVKSATVDLQSRTALVSYDPRVAKIADLEKAVDNAGFKVKGVTRVKS